MHLQIKLKSFFLLLTAAILSNEIGWFDLDENNTGLLISTLAADATLVRSALADRLSIIVQNVALTVTAFVIAFILSWRLAAVVAASLPLLIGAFVAEVSNKNHQVIISIIFSACNYKFMFSYVFFFPSNFFLKALEEITTEPTLEQLL